MELTTEVKNGVRLIKFINERKKNALSFDDAFVKLTSILQNDSENDDIVVTIITGKGEYFSSGNDLSKPLSLLEKMDFEEIVETGWIAFKNMVSAFLNYPKLLIAVINGPAVGIGVTICGLCDVVYASETATFYTPFVKLALCIEGCGSYLLPRTMGRSKASELLLLGETLTAQEALNFNIVSKVIPKGEIDGFIESLFKYGKLPVRQVIKNKKLIMDGMRKHLVDCNERECVVLKESQLSEDFSNSVMEFMKRKSKL